ncbi:MAG: class I SAM-dependent methyltransferase [Candidatus Fermentibacteraceae bacterium]|nr:class I SAM-dependent methyltransferase [Candidatus Fermentibacteraceae bacterium]
MKREECGYQWSSEFYDHNPLYSQRDDVGFYSKLAAGTRGPVLELGCGTGRILIPMARTGIDVVGLDSSESMLAVCRDKLSTEDPATASRASLILADMREFTLKRRFPLIIVPFRAFQHLLTVEDQLSCLRLLREHITPDGTFVLDLFNPSMEYILDDSRSEEYGDEPPFIMPDGRKVTRRLRNPSVDPALQVLQCQIIYHVEDPAGTTCRKVHEFSLRYIFRYEAEHLLERAGFKVTEVLGDFRGNPFGTEWPGELILLSVPE